MVSQFGQNRSDGRGGSYGDFGQTSFDDATLRKELNSATLTYNTIYVIASNVTFVVTCTSYLILQEQSTNKVN